MRIFDKLDLEGKMMPVVPGFSFGVEELNDEQLMLMFYYIGMAYDIAGEVFFPADERGEDFLMKIFESWGRKFPNGTFYLTASQMSEDGDFVPLFLLKDGDNGKWFPIMYQDGMVDISMPFMNKTSRNVRMVVSVPNDVDIKKEEE